MMSNENIKFIKYEKISDGMGGYFPNGEEVVTTLDGFFHTELEKVMLDGVLKYSELPTIYFDYHTTIPQNGQFDVVRVRGKNFRVSNSFNHKYKILTLEEA